MGWQREQFAVPCKSEQGPNQDESKKKLDEKKNVEERCREENKRQVREKHTDVSGKMFDHSKNKIYASLDERGILIRLLLIKLIFGKV